MFVAGFAQRLANEPLNQGMFLCLCPNKLQGEILPPRLKVLRLSMACKESGGEKSDAKHQREENCLEKPRTT